MKTIIAIGGGEIGRPGHEIETTEIDKEIIKCTGKSTPRLLFIPTASQDNKFYAVDVKNHFNGRLACEVDVLLLLDDELDSMEIEEKIFSSDIIYVGGGNTRQMLGVWRKKGVDKMLKEAWKKGIVISGISAGAVCWFKSFTSDSDRFTENGDKIDEYGLIKLEGLGWIDSTFCPHYDTEEKRRPFLKELMKNENSIALAVDNCAAILIRDNEYRIVRSKETVNVYKVYWRDGEFFEEAIQVSDELRGLNELTTKKI